MIVPDTLHNGKLDTSRDRSDWLSIKNILRKDTYEIISFWDLVTSNHLTKGIVPVWQSPSRK